MGVKKDNILLVTGAGGFLGRRLLIALSKEGYRIFALDINPDKDCNFNKNINYIQCDITRKPDLDKLKKIRTNIILFHLAACVPHMPSKENELINRMFEVNVNGTINLLETLKRRLVKVCYVSTLEVYGVPQYLPLNEKHPTYPRSIYGLTKLCAEHLVRLFCQKNNIPFSILRLSSVYGPGENYFRAIPNFIRAAIYNRKIRIYGNGLDRRDYVYIDDVCDAIIASSKNSDSEGLMNIAFGRSYTIKEVAQMVLKLSGSKSKISFLKINKPAYDIIFDIAKARQKIGFMPKTAFKDGLLSEIEWFRFNK